MSADCGVRGAECGSRRSCAPEKRHAGRRSRDNQLRGEYQMDFGEFSRAASKNGRGRSVREDSVAKASCVRLLILCQKTACCSRKIWRKNPGQSGAQKPRRSLAGDLFPSAMRAGTDFFGTHPKKLARAAGRGKVTESGRGLRLTSSHAGLRTPNSRLFWRGAQKSPFLAPQKSQKSRGQKVRRSKAKRQNPRRQAKKVPSSRLPTPDPRRQTF